MCPFLLADNHGMFPSEVWSLVQKHGGTQFFYLPFVWLKKSGYNRNQALCLFTVKCKDDDFPLKTLL